MILMFFMNTGEYQELPKMNPMPYNIYIPEKAKIDITLPDGRVFKIQD